MPEAFRRRWAESKSDVVIAVGAPILGVIGVLVGVATGDITTAIFGAVALVLGLFYAIPLARGTDKRPTEDDPTPP
jgi:hypothetical protein